MARIVVLGGTGYAGRHIVSEAVTRGHEVIAISRSEPADRGRGSRVRAGLGARRATRSRATFDGADAVVSALSPRGDMENRVLDALRHAVAERLTGTETRLGVVGGAGGSLVAPGGPRLFDQDFPEEYKHEAQVGIDSLALLESTDAGLDWFFVHPAEVFGPWAEGERTGTLPRRRRRDRARRRRASPPSRAPTSRSRWSTRSSSGNHRRERFTVGY